MGEFFAGSKGIGGSAPVEWGQVRGAQDVEPEAESLASIAPRIINNATELSKMADHIENSFGISSPSVPTDGAGQSKQPNLMNRLQMVEQLLQRSIYALNNINQHVNG